jgi:hypothetical protein
MARYLRQKPDPATLDAIADFICGDDREKYPEYRSSSYLTRFFNNVKIDVQHDGSTRKWWVLSVLQELSTDGVEMVILRLVDIREYKADKQKLEMAAKAMNDILFMENMSVEFRGSEPRLISLKESSDPIIKQSSSSSNEDEEEFLSKEFEENDISKLKLEGAIEVILRERVRESRQCLKSKTPLSSIIMAGSTLEGILLGVASKYTKEFNQANASPKTKEGKVRPFQEWTLESFINVAHELKMLGLDVKKFSHALRDFRNYIHPYEQASSQFTPDQHTAQICLQVLNAALADLIKVTSKEK